MCKAPKMPAMAPQPLAPAPAAPLASASEFKIAERTISRGGEFDPNTARSRRTLRTDLRMPTSGGVGVQVARM